MEIVEGRTYRGKNGRDRTVMWRNQLNLEYEAFNGRGTGIAYRVCGIHTFLRWAVVEAVCPQDAESRQKQARERGAVD